MAEKTGETTGTPAQHGQRNKDKDFSTMCGIWLGVTAISGLCAFLRHSAFVSPKRQGSIRAMCLQGMSLRQFWLCVSRETRFLTL